MASFSEHTLIDNILKEDNKNGDHENIETSDGEAIDTAPKRKMLKKSIISTENEEKLMDLVFGNKTKLINELAKSTINNKSCQPSEPNPTTITASNQHRQLAWHDSSDEELDVNDVIDYRKKGAPIIQKTGTYKAYLENNYKTILGTPAWAEIDRHRESDSDEEILQKNVAFVQKQSGQKLPKNKIQCKRLRDLNRATYAEGPGITGIEFHPTSTVALVTGRGGVASIYSIDGSKNDKLHNIEFKNYPIACCRLSRNGMEAILGSSRNFFYTYSLLTGENQRIFLPKTITQMNNFELSPCGKIIAIVGRFGEIYFLDSAGKELIGKMKQEYQSTALAFSQNSQQLLSHSNDSEINVFDLRMQRIQHRFIDEGCINGATLTTSLNGQFLACGSKQGVVNVYNIQDVMQSTTPKPLKTVFNLTTAVHATKFNHSTEILAIDSKELNNAIKMVHISNGSVFSNFPDSQAQFGKVTVLNFSPQSGYMAVGTTGKAAMLFRLKHFGNY